MAPSLPFLNPACAKDVGRCEDHAAGQLDREGSYLPDQVRPRVEALDSGGGGGFEVREGAYELTFMEDDPMVAVRRLELLSHPLEGGDVFAQHCHDASLGARIGWYSLNQIKVDGGLSRDPGRRRRFWI